MTQTNQSADAERSDKRSVMGTQTDGQTDKTAGEIPRSQPAYAGDMTFTYTKDTKKAYRSGRLSYSFPSQ